MQRAHGYRHTFNAGVETVIERQPFGRFLDLHDNGLVGEMAA